MWKAGRKGLLRLLSIPWSMARREHVRDMLQLLSLPVVTLMLCCPWRCWAVFEAVHVDRVMLLCPRPLRVSCQVRLLSGAAAPARRPGRLQGVEVLSNQLTLARKATRKGGHRRFSLGGAEPTRLCKFALNCVACFITYATESTCD